MKRLSYFLSRFKTMTVTGLLSRVTTILLRYGLTANKFGNTVMPMVDLCRSFGIVPTFPVTASAVKRNPEFFQKLQNRGAELAVHGMYHHDYTLISVDDANIHYSSAIKIFRDNDIHFRGFRFPYLRRDAERISLLDKYGFHWDSSEVISWPGIDPSEVSQLQWDAYQKILETYEADSIHSSLSLPCFRKKLVEIPVSVPDDDILIERVKFTKDKISPIWKKMLFQTIQNREMLVLQLHPERFREFQQPLDDVLSNFKETKDGWSASLDEIARWWQTRHSFKINPENLSPGLWRIHTNIGDSGSILVRNLQPDKYTKKLDDISGLMKATSFQIKSRKKPVVGIHPECKNWIVEHLKNDGYPHDISSDAEMYSCYIHPDMISNSRNLDAHINQIKEPLVQIWRWPDMKTFCFCVSGDIDGITLMDFWDRTHGKI